MDAAKEHPGEYHTQQSAAAPLAYLILRGGISQGTTAPSSTTCCRESYEQRHRLTVQLDKVRTGEYHHCAYSYSLLRRSADDADQLSGPSAHTNDMAYGCHSSFTSGQSIKAHRTPGTGAESEDDHHLG